MRDRDREKSEGGEKGGKNKETKGKERKTSTSGFAPDRRHSYIKRLQNEGVKNLSLGTDASYSIHPPSLKPGNKCSEPFFPVWRNQLPRAEAKGKRKVDCKDSGKPVLEKDPLLLHAKALSIDNCLNPLNGQTKISNSFTQTQLQGGGGEPTAAAANNNMAMIMIFLLV